MLYIFCALLLLINLNYILTVDQYKAPVGVLSTIIVMVSYSNILSEKAALLLLMSSCYIVLLMMITYHVKLIKRKKELE